jgi:hypothetical protein
MTTLLTGADDFERVLAWSYPRCFPRPSFILGLAPKTETSDHGSAARKELEEQDYYGNDQQQVDESTANSTDQTQ